jgi:predicted Zn-dependent protease
MGVTVQGSDRSNQLAHAYTRMAKQALPITMHRFTHQSIDRSRQPSFHGTHATHKTRTQPSSHLIDMYMRRQSMHQHTHTRSTTKQTNKNKQTNKQNNRCGTCAPRFWGSRSSTSTTWTTRCGWVVALLGVSKG